jgi:hypothetical protein
LILGRRRAQAVLLDAAIDCAHRGWAVVPGAVLVRQGRIWACACGDPDCELPGDHPVHSDWPERASTDVETIAWWWSGSRQPTLILPTGLSFDVWDVPAPVGRMTYTLLLRSTVPVGPVAVSAAGRWQFLTAPSLGEPLPDLAEHWDLRHRGEGRYLAAPPSGRGPLGAARWVHAPAVASRRLLGAAMVARTLAKVAEHTSDLAALSPPEVVIPSQRNGSAW